MECLSILSICRVEKQILVPCDLLATVCLGIHLCKCIGVDSCLGVGNDGTSSNKISSTSHGGIRRRGAGWRCGFILQGECRAVMTLERAHEGRGTEEEPAAVPEPVSGAYHGVGNECRRMRWCRQRGYACMMRSAGWPRVSRECHLYGVHRAHLGLPIKFEGC